MSILQALELFEDASNAVKDGDCPRAKRLYRKGLTAERKALQRGGPSYKFTRMFDARFVARTYLRRGCFYMHGPKR